MAPGHSWKGRWSRPKLNNKMEKEGEFKPLFSEHFLSPDKLADIFPLARIESQNLLSSRGISQEEARLRLAENRQFGHRFSTLFFANFLFAHFHLIFHSFRFPLLICAFLFLLFPPIIPSYNFSIFLSSPILIGLFKFIFLSFTIFLSAYQKWKAKRAESAFFGLKSPSDQIFTAIREGRKAKVKAMNILAGELILVKAGQRMPFDIRILKIIDGPLMADCGWLMNGGIGNNYEAQIELTDSTAQKHLDIFQARNILFAGSICTQGNALGLVIRKGKRTLISRLISHPTNGIIPSPGQYQKCPSIRREFHKLLRICLFLSIGLALLPFLLFVLLFPSAHFLSVFLHIFLLLFIGLLPHSLPIAWDANLLWILRQFRQKCGAMLLRNFEAIDEIGATKILMIHNSAVLSANRSPILTNFWLASTNRRIETAKMVDWAVRENGKRRIGPKEIGEQFGQEAVELLRAAAFCCRNGGKKREENKIGNGEIGRRKTSIWRSLRTKVAPTNDGTSAPKIGQLNQRELDQNTPKFVGNPDDEAFFKFFEQIMPIELLKEGAELMALEGPNNPFAFHSDWRTPTLAFLKEGDEGKCRMIASGAPEELLRICSMVREADDDERGELPLTEEHLIQFEQEFLRLSAQSKRCLAVATLDLANENADCFDPSSLSNTEDWRSDLTEGGGEWTFIGLLAFSELPNENCGQKMEELKMEGIRAILLSEEHPAMVQAMSKLIGMNGRIEGINGQKEGKGKWRLRIPRRHKGHSNCSSAYHSKEMDSNINCKNVDENAEKEWPIEGELLAEMNSKHLDRLVDGTDHLAFSRLESNQIVHLIRLFQAKGHSVTFIGKNGLLDWPALRQADFGIVGANPNCSFLLSPADALCPNPQLANIQTAIRHGRTFRRNLASIAAFSISHCPAIVLPFILTAIFGFPLALSSIQVLSISFIFAIFPSIGLLLSPPSSHPLPTPNSVLFSTFIRSLLLSGSIIAFGSFFAFLSVFWNFGNGIGDLFGSPSIMANSILAHSTNITTQSLLHPNSIISAKAAAAWQLTLIGSQQFNAWFCAGILANSHRFDFSIFRKNIALWLSIFINLILLIFIAYLPFLNAIFGIRPPPAHIWVFPLAISILLLVSNLAIFYKFFASIPTFFNLITENTKKKKATKWSPSIC